MNLNNNNKNTAIYLLLSKYSEQLSRFKSFTIFSGSGRMKFNADAVIYLCAVSKHSVTLVIFYTSPLCWYFIFQSFHIHRLVSRVFKEKKKEIPLVRLISIWVFSYSYIPSKNKNTLNLKSVGFQLCLIYQVMLF